MVCLFCVHSVEAQPCQPGTCFCRGIVREVQSNYSTASEPVCINSLTHFDSSTAKTKRLQRYLILGSQTPRAGYFVDGAK